MKVYERKYSDFSDRACAGWLCVSDETLEEFEEWLTGIDI